nr:hypothetical protein [Tanacetum cinerariifolium]
VAGVGRYEVKHFLRVVGVRIGSVAEGRIVRGQNAIEIIRKAEACAHRRFELAARAHVAVGREGYGVRGVLVEVGEEAL